MDGGGRLAWSLRLRRFASDLVAASIGVGILTREWLERRRAAQKLRPAPRPVPSNRYLALLEKYLPRRIGVVATVLILVGSIGLGVVKGGHLGGTESPDVLVSDAGTHWVEGRRVPTKTTHGTGCSLSSAIAAELAKGSEPQQAVAAAKDWLAGAVASAQDLSVGSGHGPVHHFHALWNTEGNR